MGEYMGRKRREKWAEEGWVMAYECFMDLNIMELGGIRLETASEKCVVEFLSF